MIATKDTSLQGNQHTLAKVRLDSGKTMYVDLGPRSNLRDVALDRGDEITVQGKPIRLNDRKVIQASLIEADDQRIRIEDRADRTDQYRQRLQRNIRNMGDQSSNR